MNARTLLACVVTLYLALAHSAWAAPADEAKATVEKLHSTLLEAMQGGTRLGFKGRYEKIAPVLADTFDFPTIARVATGRYWSKFDAAKQQEFIEVFKRLSAATYAANFDAFDGERFETKGTEDKRGMQLVRTVIVSSDGKPTSLNYTLGDKSGMWRIINVVADGVSDLSLKRAEYTAAIESDGIDALIAKLNDKIRTYESGQ